MRVGSKGKQKKRNRTREKEQVIKGTRSKESKEKNEKKVNEKISSTHLGQGGKQLVGVVLEEGCKGKTLVLLAATIVAVDANVLVQVVASRETLGAVHDGALEG